MIAQLALPGAFAAAGAIAGIIEMLADKRLEAKRIEIEANRDQHISRDGNIDKFYRTLDRSDDPKKIVKTLTIPFLNIYWNHEKYEFVPIPARQYRFIIVLLLTLAKAAVVCWCAIFADLLIYSFPAEPDSYRWLSLFGFSLVEGTRTTVYELTLGGLILPLLSPDAFVVAKWVTGSGGK